MRTYGAGGKVGADLNAAVTKLMDSRASVERNFAALITPMDGNTLQMRVANWRFIATRDPKVRDEFKAATDKTNATLANLEKAGISTTLVCVVKRGVNESEIGGIVRHALTYSCVRGVTFQPVQDAGRNLNFDKNRDRVVLTDIRREIGTSGVFGTEDVIPLPCNPDQIAIGYGLRNGRGVTPMTRTR